jgi:predicted nucleic acid-binding Zn ribbon protein
MPLYNYKCTKCGKIFEDVPQSINDDKLETAQQIEGAELDCEKKKCPIKRMVGNLMRMQLKGSGFHCNDYAKNYEVLQGKDGKPGKTRR